MPIDPNTTEYHDLVKQVNAEQSSSVRYLARYWNRWRREEELLLHQTRAYEEEVAIGKRKATHIKDFLLFSKLVSKHRKLRLLRNVVHFENVPGQDRETVQLMNKLLDYDYKKANKAIIDSLRNFNAARYGVSDMLVHGINKDGIVPMKVMHQPSFYFSPQAISGQGVEKQYRYRWAGYVIRTSKTEMKKNAKYWDVPLDDLNLPTSPPFQELETPQEQEKQIMKAGTDNDPVYLSAHYTYFEGQMTYVVMAYDKILKYEKLYFSHLPFITRQLYWIPNQRNIQSIPLQIADKQRVRQRLYNDSIKNELRSKSNITLYDKNKILQPHILSTTREAAIPVTGGVKDAVQMMPRAEADSTTSYLITMMDDLASEVSGQSRIQQGISPANAHETATATFTQQQQANENELAHVESFIEDDKALPVLVMENYIKQTPTNFRKKIIVSSGLQNEEVLIIPASRLKTLSKDALGEVIVRNSLLDERERAGRVGQIPSIVQYAALLAQQGADLEEAVRFAYETYGLDPEKIDSIIPPNSSVIHAQNEGTEIKQKVQVRARITDNHRVHKMEHAKEPDSKLMRDHILEHTIYEAILAQNPQIQQFISQQQNPVAQQQGVGSLTPNGAQAPQPNASLRSGVPLTQQSATEPPLQPA